MSRPVCVVALALLCYFKSSSPKDIATISAAIEHPCNEPPPLTSSISSVTLQTDVAAVDGGGGGPCPHPDPGLADLLLKG